MVLIQALRSTPTILDQTHVPEVDVSHLLPLAACTGVPEWSEQDIRERDAASQAATCPKSRVHPALPLHFRPAGLPAR